MKPSKRIITTNATDAAKVENPFRNLEAVPLRQYEGELRALAAAYTSALARTNNLLGMVKQALGEIENGGETLRVSDHAIVRFIERFGGGDMAEVRAAILAMIEAGRPEVAVRDGVVVTILPEGAESVDALGQEARMSLFAKVAA